MQRLRPGAAEAGLVGQLACFAQLLPPEGRPDVVQRLVRAAQECSSWRVRSTLAEQLTPLAQALPLQVLLSARCCGQYLLLPQGGKVATALHHEPVRQ
jgi:hypothetical protein